MLMKPSRSSDESQSPQILRPLSTGSGTNDSSHFNVYEFQEGEDQYGARSRGYRKPKHIWMAKEQTLTSNKAPMSPIAPDALSVGNNYCTDRDHCQAVLCSSDHITCLSPGLPISPTVNCAQGLSNGLSSCTNTSSSLYSHTPPTNGHSISGVSACTTPSFSEPHVAHPVSEDMKQAKMEVSYTTSISLSCSEDKVMISTIVSDPVQIPPSTANTQLQKARRRQSRVNRPCTSRKSKRSSNLNPVPNIQAPTGTGSVEVPPAIAIEKSSLDAQSSTSKTSPVFTPTGLKIRLRRDIVPTDASLNKRKRKNKSVGVFRIVESWCDVDAPGGDYSRRISAIGSTSTSPSMNLVSGGLKVGDIVWAKLAGYPYWPSQISAIWARTPHQLSQATPLPTSQISGDGTQNSLAVLATPVDPNLATGYTARVDWLAWDQFSYLSCGKLYPFTESFEKLYNPRTRVKGYAEAVRLAKLYVSGTSNSVIESHSHSSPQTKSHSFGQHLSAPPSTDSQWSAMTTLSSVELSTSLPGSLTTKDLTGLHTTNNTHNNLAVKNLVDQNHHSAESVTVTDPFSSTTGSLCDGVDDKPADLLDLSNMSTWAPLPQLDINGLHDFVFHVPTFSEDEDDLDQSFSNHLQIDFGSCT